MSSHTGVDVAIIATAALAVGWYSHRWRSTHLDLKSQIKKVTTIRTARRSEAGRLTLLIVVTLLVVLVLANHG